jgi:hypothetical protein
LVGLAPGVGRGLNRFRRVIGSPLVRRFVQQKMTEPVCTWITGLRSLGETGLRLFWSRKKAVATPVELTPAAERQGLNMTPLPKRIGLEDLIPALQRLGMETKYIEGFGGNLEQLRSYSKRHGQGVVAFTIEYVGDRHTLYAQGGKFIDTTGEVFESVNKLRQRYPNARLFTDHGGPYFLTGTTMVKPSLQVAGVGAMLALSLKPVPVEVYASPASPSAVPPQVPPLPPGPAPDGLRCETLGGVHDGGTTALCVGKPHVYVVQNGDYPAPIAQKVYGNPAEWPRIYHANKARIGPNPYSIYAWKPGQVLTIP